MKKGIKFLIAYFLVFLAIFAYSATEANTTMTWVVPASVSHTLAYGGACSSSAFYFIESNCVLDSDTDGNGSKCVPYDAESGGSACQSVSTAGMTITNNGNVDINVDGNFTAAFSGADVNLVLKVWMGTGAGCGASGLGGWEDPCSVTSATAPVTSTTCRNYNEFNETTAGRLVNILSSNDTNQLCFSGDFNSSVSQGSHAVTFRTTSIQN